MLKSKVQLLQKLRMEHAAAGLEKIVAEFLQRASSNEAQVLAWPLVCGSAVAERTRALGSGDGVLRVEVANATWKSELQSLAPQYLAAINRYAPGRVHKIEFVVARSENADSRPR